MKRSVLTLAGVILLATIAPVNFAGAKSIDEKDRKETRVNQEKLVAEFVSSLVRAQQFKSVQHLFLSQGDFPGLLEELKKAPGLPEYKRRQLEGKHNLNKQKVALRNSIQRNIKEPWERITTSIKDGTLRLRYSTFKTRERVQGGLTILEIHLKFVVTKHSRDYTVSKHIKVMKIGQKLKIVHLFHRI